MLGMTGTAVVVLADEAGLGLFMIYGFGTIFLFEVYISLMSVTRCRAIPDR
jgi:hypothetical protein